MKKFIEIFREAKDYKYNFYYCHSINNWLMIAPTSAICKKCELIKIFEDAK